MEIFDSPIGFREQYKVRTYEIDSRKEMNVPALVRLMQEAAMQNVIELKLPVWDLSPKGVSWILNRVPVLGEDITVYTYPSGLERLFTFRDFCVTDSAGGYWPGHPHAGC
ncbi:MAG TPA: thioesterase [Flavilitoribacter sp.]|nr:thioesterase [Flavilitoribacter sp.]